MSRLKKVEKRGERRYLLFPLSLADSRVKSLPLPSHLISHSPTLLTASAPESSSPGGYRGLENRNESKEAEVHCSREKRSLFLSSNVKAGQKASVCSLSEKVFITFRTT